MALGDVGIFNPAESLYQTPGTYGETLKADALKRADYLASMDQFYEQLDETKRQFDETLAFKTSALAQDKWLAEQNIALGKEELELKRELGEADINLRTKALEAEGKYRTESLAVERMKIGASATPIRLGRDTSTDKAYDILERYLLSGSSSKPRITTTPGGSHTASGSVSYGSTARSSSYEPMTSGDWFA